MSNYTIDTIAFVSMKEDSKLKDLKEVIELVLEERGEARVTLGDVISRLGYKFENNTINVTYIEGVEKASDILYLYASSRSLPSVMEIEFLSGVLELKYFIKTSDSMRGLYINTDTSGEVFPLRYATEYIGKYDALREYYDEYEMHNITYGGGWGFDSLRELAEHFHKKYGVVFSEEEINDIDKISKIIKKLNWKFDFPIQGIRVSEEQVEYISNCIEAQK